MKLTKDQACKLLGLGRAPHGARGLKLQKAGVNQIDLAVAPRMGRVD